MVATTSTQPAEPSVVVLAYGESCVKFVSWFLQESGVANTRVTEVAAAQREVSLRGRCVLVINSREDSASIASIVSSLRPTARGLYIICLHMGRHADGDTPVDADLCVHEPGDPDYLASLVELVRTDRH